VALSACDVVALTVPLAFGISNSSGVVCMAVPLASFIGFFWCRLGAVHLAGFRWCIGAILGLCAFWWATAWRCVSK